MGGGSQGGQRLPAILPFGCGGVSHPLVWVVFDDSTTDFSAKLWQVV